VKLNYISAEFCDGGVLGLTSLYMTRMTSDKTCCIAFRLRNDLYCVGWGVKLYYIEKNCIQSIQCCISRRSKTAKIKCYKL